mgnify:CR=1 FL=1
MAKFVVEFGRDGGPVEPDGRLDAAAFHRNHGPILAVLQRFLAGKSGDVLEAGSGTGQPPTLQDAYNALKMSVGLAPERLELDMDRDGKVTSLDDLAGKRTYGTPGLNFTKMLEAYNEEHPENPIIIEYTELDLQLQFQNLAAGLVDYQRRRDTLRAVRRLPTSTTRQLPPGTGRVDSAELRTTAVDHVARVLPAYDDAVLAGDVAALDPALAEQYVAPLADGLESRRHILFVPAVTVEIGSIESEKFASLLAQNQDAVVQKLSDKLAYASYTELKIDGDKYLARLVTDALRDITGTRGLDDKPSTGSPDTKRYGVVAVSLPASFVLH